MSEDRNRGKGRGRKGRGGDAPGWNASAAAGSHGAGGAPRPGGGADEHRPRGEGRRRGWGSGGRANPESRSREEPESWVGRPAGGGYPRSGDRGTPYGVPQGWRSEDNYTLSPERQGGERDVGYGRGPFTGRGPEGYTRSDERIREDVCDRLTEHGGIDASAIRVAVEKGEVILEGTVEERVEKWMAEEVADSVAGVRDVQNRIRLRGRGGEPG